MPPDDGCDRLSQRMPGEVRCPTCGRTTALAPQCLHCGGVIPEGAARPRGLDRQGLEERIRLRRSGEAPFHRGSGDWPAADSAAGGAPFVPEPADALTRREADASDDPAPRVDHLAEVQRPGPTPEWPAPQPRPEPARPVDPPPPPIAPVPAPPASTASAYHADEPYSSERYDSSPIDERDATDRYEPVGPSSGYGGGDGGDGYDAYDGYEDGGPRRSGGFAILGFVILGIAALLGGVFFFSVLNSSPGAADASASATPTLIASGSATPTDTGAASPSASAGSSQSATESPTEVPSAVPADFTAQAQPCATSDMDFHGCTKDGTTISGSKVWIWVGFRNARASDVMGVTILQHSDGSSVGDGSLELTNIGCTADKPCTGYIQMPFSQLAVGEYDISVTLNGQQVATSAFSVTG
jgi:hypothetical protein